MSRSICTVFMALAIFQDAFAITVEPDRIINLVVTNQTSPTIKSFDGERTSGFIGDMTVGNVSSDDNYYNVEVEFRNPAYFIVHAVTNLSDFRGRNIHYVQAVNKEGSAVALCADESSLGKNWILVNGRFPPYSRSTIKFTVGSSSSVKAIQALLIPFTVITLLLTNYHL
ncbi:uncharacterized protein LOC143213028 [Lasioglossum baleicum]|uniref:uncharacterized protein LOC143213028 n=1 Tax=Lasioglossum baleicum TaxID=434251 RepID=UPI003FCE5CF7